MLRSDYKRKRRDLAAGRVLAVYTPRKKRRVFTAGKDRVGGYYGRYAGRGGELKFHDLQLDQADIITGGVVLPSVNLIAQGVGESARVGRKCTLRSIEWKWFLALSQKTDEGVIFGGDRLRMIMYIDKQCNGSVATVLQLLEVADDNSFYNLAEQNRFTILCDKSIDVNYLTAASGASASFDMGQVIKAGSFKKSLNLPIEYSSTTGVIAEVRSNNIGILLISTAGRMNITSRIRVRFSDQ